MKLSDIPQTWRKPLVNEFRIVIETNLPSEHWDKIEIEIGEITNPVQLLSPLPQVKTLHEIFNEPPIFLSMKPTTRNQFGALFQSVFQTGAGAEIGVQTGHNAKNIFESGWQGGLHCIDNWVRDEEFIEAAERLKDYKVILTKSDSVEAAEYFADYRFDFVYIDAGHARHEVESDFFAWFPKVRSGGIISGHDYAPANHKNDCDGVRQFIDDYMAANPDVEMNFTTDDIYYGDDKNIYGNEYQSWWFVKK